MRTYRYLHWSVRQIFASRKEENVKHTFSREDPLQSPFISGYGSSHRGRRGCQILTVTFVLYRGFTTIFLQIYIWEWPPVKNKYPATDCHTRFLETIHCHLPSYVYMTVDTRREENTKCWLPYTLTHLNTAILFEYQGITATTREEQDANYWLSQLFSRKRLQFTCGPKPLQRIIFLTALWIEYKPCTK